jgi:hypothetical protein
VLFAALDVREIFHHVDENRTGLAVLAGAAPLRADAADAVVAHLRIGFALRMLANSFPSRPAQRCASSATARSNRGRRNPAGGRFDSFAAPLDELPMGV